MIAMNSWALTSSINVDRNNSLQPELSQSERKSVLNEMDRVIKIADQLNDKLDKALLHNVSNPVSAQALSMILSHQKEMVLSMISIQNPEAAIAGALAGSIEAYGKQLEQLKAWTDGGSAMFEAALLLMMQDITKEGLTPEELENLFQVMLLEIMQDPAKYGLENWYADNKLDIAHLLENTGSGSHGYHEGYDAATLADVSRKLYNSLRAQTLPDGSLLDEAFKVFDAAGGSDSLFTQIKDNYLNDSGWIKTCNEYSPMLRLFILSEALKMNPNMSQSDVEMCLTGSFSDLNAFITKLEPGLSTDPRIPSALVFLFAHSPWNPESISSSSGPILQMDYVGTQSIDSPALDDIAANFPARSLTEDETKRMNDIGDQVKALFETLKYWLSIMRDNVLASARAY
ncbi:hypothetical protein KFE26_22595 [Shewanella sp. M16]|uniref:hypothetical protein n=1 Tax=Shewanella sp. M16 TaxID=2830837 RepID=UPI001BAF42AD|nr:hypothetical protein [Shewanella sp. M16]MBS0045046.1 hypothetical protein [Shewanella sp. M16]